MFSNIPGFVPDDAPEPREGFEVVAMGEIQIDMSPGAPDVDVQIKTAIAAAVDQLKAMGVIPPDAVVGVGSDDDQGPEQGHTLPVIAI